MVINWTGVIAEVVPYYHDDKHKQVKLTFNKGDELGESTGETVEILLPCKAAHDIGSWLIELSQEARAKES